jgi:HlyD family secretion protein
LLSPRPVVTEEAMKFLGIVLVLLALAGAALGFWYWGEAGNSHSAFRTAPVERGDLLATIGATGVIQPEEVIDVGAQVAGQIKQFGRDPRDSSRPIDYGTAVEEGTVLALLDDSLFQARVDRAEAMLRQARAQVAQADADLKRAEADLSVMQAKLRQAERDWERAQKLQRGRGISDFEFDTALSNHDAARATVGSGETAIDQAKAARHRAEEAIPAAEADLREAQRNLGYTRITSPVKGVIIDRRVNVGQTVVASLNAPSLFLIAKDLKRLQVWASVNEADIGNVHLGQPVVFTVDAYPGEPFRGQVAQIRLNASMTQNVVTYTVVVSTDNSHGRLLPYLTANLHFELARRQDVLLVPNTALRYRPGLTLVAPDARDEYARSLKKRRASPEAGDKDRGDQATLWVEDGGFVRPVKVRIGLSDGTMTELVEGDLAEGTSLVIGEVSNGSAAEGTSNPFTPQMFGGKKKE